LVSNIFYKELFMKSNTMVRLAILAGCALVLCSSCKQDADDPVLGGGELTVVVATNDGTVYYSLASGEKVADGATAGWDIAFKRPRLIYTNGGASAAASGGEGGVWHTDKTDFGAVSLGDKSSDTTYTSYYTDVKKWIKGMSSATETVINIMTYVGYGSGDGSSSENAFQSYAYNQKQFYKSATMGAFEPTGQVYIIKHGDGSHYSKIKIEEYESSTANGTDTYLIRYQNLN
jgi:hypothetical protein